MPLYNNILSSRKGDETTSGEKNDLLKSSPSASMKLLQDHLLSKKRAQQQLQLANKIRKATDKKPQIDLHQQSDSSVWDVEEEYDPMIPNSYEVVKAEYLKTEKQRLANSMSLASSKKLRVPHLLDVIDKLDENNDISYGEDKKNRGTAIAPPPSLSSSSSRTPTIDEGNNDMKDVKPLPAGDIAKSRPEVGASIAAKIMSKMGYKQGQGLGKDEQGISEPLEVEKSGLNVGKIMPPTKSSAKKDNCNVDKKPLVDEIKLALERARKESTSRILLLQNMVGPGEVDEDLESETKEECTKYGDVIKCLIYEIPNKKVPDDEAVRIFVEFRRAESALKAANDLNGRYFGGRIVRASFYSVEKFNKYELAP